MPGYANYKRLYIEEYKTLFDEGFDVEKYMKTSVAPFTAVAVESATLV